MLSLGKKTDIKIGEIDASPAEKNKIDEIYGRLEWDSFQLYLEADHH